MALYRRSPFGMLPEEPCHERPFQHDSLSATSLLWCATRTAKCRTGVLHQDSTRGVVQAVALVSMTDPSSAHRRRTRTGTGSQRVKRSGTARALRIRWCPRHVTVAHQVSVHMCE